jgi:hypothetical protein
MNNPPITGNADLDSYLYNLHMYNINDTSTGYSSNTSTGEITDSAGNVVGYLYQFLNIKYADDTIGTNISNSPTNRLYYGVRNSTSSTESTNPADYTWYAVSGGFGTTKFLYYSVLGGRQIKFDVNTAPFDYHWLLDSGASINLDIVVPPLTITSTEIASDAITELKLAADAVTAAKLNVAAIDGITGNLVANSVGTTQITDDAIISSKITANAITAGKIAANAVTAVKIDASAVTTDKLAANAVTSAKVTTGELITLSAQIANGIITTAKIGDAQITNAKIGDTIQSSNFVSGSTGWQILKNGSAEFNDVVISRQLLYDSGTFTGLVNTTNNNTLSDKATFYIETNTASSAWAGTDTTFLALISLSNATVNANSGDVTSQPQNVQWGASALVVPITRWSGNARIFLKVSVYTRLVNYVSADWNWYLYKVT